MPAWLLPAISAAGGVVQNLWSAKAAKDDRRFQERMSSSAAQRSQADYAKAGLNPALAYDRPASSPGGATAQVEDAVGKGVSSALEARMQRKQFELIDAQQRKLNVETEATRWNTVANNWRTIAETRAIAQNTAFQAALQPHQYRSAEVAKLMAEYGLDKGAAESAYYRMMGAAAPAIDNLSGPAAALGGAALGGAALLRRAAPGMVTSSGRTVQGLFRPPAPRRTGDWERVNRNRGDIRPRGIER